MSDYGLFLFVAVVVVAIVIPLFRWYKYSRPDDEEHPSLYFSRKVQELAGSFHHWRRVADDDRKKDKIFIINEIGKLHTLIENKTDNINWMTDTLADRLNAKDKQMQEIKWITDRLAERFDAQDKQMQEFQRDMMSIVQASLEDGK